MEDEVNEGEAAGEAAITAARPSKAVKINIENGDDEVIKSDDNVIEEDKIDLPVHESSFTDKNSQYYLLRMELLQSRIAGDLVMFEKKNYAEKDIADQISIDPSYTDFVIPYSVKCRIRYTQQVIDYDKQFKKEMNMLEIYQQNAYEAARFSRHLGMTTLWPPLHNRREINKFTEKYFVHTPKNRTRLNNLLSEVQT